MFGRSASERTLATALLVGIAALAGLGAGSASAAWLGVSDLAPANPSNRAVGAPSIAVARDGTAYVAFQHFDGSNFRAAVVMRSPGGGFGAVRDLSPAGQDAFSPASPSTARATSRSPGCRARPSSSRRACARRAATGARRRRRCRPGRSQRSQPRRRRQRRSRSWRGGETPARGRPRRGRRPPLRGARRFGAALPASPAAGTGLCQPPRVAIDAAGDVAAIWTRRTSAGGDYHVESAVKAAGAAAFAAVRATLADGPGNSNCNSDIQMTPDGRVTAMWDFTELGRDAVPRLRRSRRAVRRRRVEPRPSSCSAPATRRPSRLFALDDAGNAAATWLSARRRSSPRSAQASAGSRRRKPLSGATDTRGASGRRSPNGDALAAFVGKSNGDDAVFAARRRRGDGVRRGDAGAPSPRPAAPPSPRLARHRARRPGQRVRGLAATVAQATYSAPGRRLRSRSRRSITAADVPAARDGRAGRWRCRPRRPTGCRAPALHFDFGDGSGADGATVQHIYGAAGTYTVTVTATDARRQPRPAPRARSRSHPRPCRAGPPGPRPEAACSPPRRASWDRLRNGRTRMRSLVVDELTGPETGQAGVRQGQARLPQVGRPDGTQARPQGRLRQGT